MFVIEINKNFINDELINEIVDEVIARLNMLNTKEDIIVFGKYQASIFQNDYNIIDFKKSNGTEKIFITELSSKLLISLANLTHSTLEDEFILNSIINGREVYVFKDNIEYKKYLETLPKEIFKKYFSYENALKSYDIKFIKTLDEVKKNKTNKKQLVCLNNIGQYIFGQKVILNKNAIITPSAKDYIMENKLIIERR